MIIVSILKRQRSQPSPAHLFFAMIGRHKWVMAKLPRLDAETRTPRQLRPLDGGIMAAIY